MKETVLLFHIEDRAQKLSIEQALFPYHVRLRKIEKERYSETLGQLVGLLDTPDSPLPYDGDELEAPMMIFAGIPDRKLDSMLQSLRERKVRIPYKAILTPTNQAWTPQECFAELKREHEAMSGHSFTPGPSET